MYFDRYFSIPFKAILNTKISKLLYNNISEFVRILINLYKGNAP